MCLIFQKKFIVLNSFHHSFTTSWENEIVNVLKIKRGIFVHADNIIMKTRNLLEIGQEIIDEYSKEQWMHGFIRGYCEAYK